MVVEGSGSFVVPFAATIVGVGISAYSMPSGPSGLCWVALKDFNGTFPASGVLDGSMIATMTGSDGNVGNIFIPCSIQIPQGQTIFYHNSVDDCIFNICLQGNA